MSTNEVFKRTPLYRWHVAAGAKLVPFAGFEMPLQYAGILAEHRQVREAAGLFDTSHMGQFLLEGPGAASDLDKLVTCRIETLKAGKARYGFLLNERGTFVDDLFVYRLDVERFFVVVNASTRAKDREWILARLSSESFFEDLSEGSAMIALQGPKAPAVLSRIWPEAAAMPRFGVADARIDGNAVRVARTGYTGEDGYELFAPATYAVTLWERLVAAPEVAPCGLGARDTLRLEKGYSLYGSDIDEDHTPAEADLLRYVAVQVPPREKYFIGRTSLEAAGAPRVLLTGLVCEGRQSPRHGNHVFRGDAIVGRVTSGAFSPSLQRGIGLAYLSAGNEVAGTEVTISDGARSFPAVVTKPPFV